MKYEKDLSHFEKLLFENNPNIKLHHWTSKNGWEFEDKRQIYYVKNIGPNFKQMELIKNETYYIEHCEGSGKYKFLGIESSNFPLASAIFENIGEIPLMNIKNLVLIYEII